MASRPKCGAHRRRKGVLGEVPLAVRGAGGDSHQQQAKQEGPKGDSVRLGELGVHHRATSARRGRLTLDRDGPPLGNRLGMQGDRLGRLLVDFLNRAHEAAAVGDGVLRLRTLTRVEPLGDLDLALPLEEDPFHAHLVFILPQDAGPG